MHHPSLRSIAPVSRRFNALSRFRRCACLAALVAIGAAHAATIEASIHDAAGNPVPDAAVYAMPSSGPLETRTASATIEQIDREFVPYVSVVQQGTTVAFPNRDPIMHHVYSFSPAKAFEIKLYTGEAPRRIVFDKAGVVTLGCNIHDWMIGYLLVVATPWFATTGADGIARIHDVPAGAYTLHVWHPRQRAALAPVAAQLEVAARYQADFRLDVEPRRVKFKPPLDRMRY